MIRTSGAALLLGALAALANPAPADAQMLDPESEYRFVKCSNEVRPGCDALFPGRFNSWLRGWCYITQIAACMSDTEGGDAAQLDDGQ